VQRVEYTDARHDIRETKRFDGRNRANATHNAWTSNTEMSCVSFSDSLYVGKTESDILESQCQNDDKLSSIVCQLSASVKLQMDQLVNKLERRLHIQVDSSLQGITEHQSQSSTAGSTADQSQQELLAVLDNLQLMGRQLLAVNKALSSPPVTKPARRERQSNARH
jgi:hypothetical protein